MLSFYDRYWAKRNVCGYFELRWNVLKKYIPRDNGVVIIDFGCGKGQALEKMAEINPNATYIGLDVTDVALDTAKSKLPHVEFRKIEDGGKIPIQDDFADFVLASEVIEHVYDVENTLLEISRILKPNGALLLTTPYHGLIKNILIAIFSFEKHFDPAGGHIRFFTKNSLFKSLENAGLHPKEYGYFGRIYPIPHCIYLLSHADK